MKKTLPLRTYGLSLKGRWGRIQRRQELSHFLEYGSIIPGNVVIYAKELWLVADKGGQVLPGSGHLVGNRDEVIVFSRRQDHASCRPARRRAFQQVVRVKDAEDRVTAASKPARGGKLSSTRRSFRAIQIEPGWNASVGDEKDSLHPGSAGVERSKREAQFVAATIPVGAGGLRVKMERFVQKRLQVSADSSAVNPCVDHIDAAARQHNIWLRVL
jgi:hypothetical protein